MSTHSHFKQSIGSRLFDAFNYVLMVSLMFVFIYPFINLLALSLNDSMDSLRGGIYFLPRKFTTAAYELIVRNQKIYKGTIWSVLRILCGTSTMLFCTGLLAYLVTVPRFSGRKFLRRIFFLTMYFGGGLIPYYLLIVNLGLTNNFFVYIIPALFNTYYMLLMSSYFQTLPEAMFASASIDGASELTIYWRIVMPVALPVYASVAIYSAVGHWNSWFDVVLYNSNGTFDTLQVVLRRILLEQEGLNMINDQQVLYEKFRNMTPITIRSAVTMVVVAPILIVYPMFQKYFIGGMTIGSVKG